MSNYDRTTTIFSPDGRLFQVDYAQETVNKGNSAVGICGKSIAVLGVERKVVGKLQIENTVRKIASIDDHIAVAFAGLTADARKVIKDARAHSLNHKLMMEDRILPSTLARFVADLKQKFTRSSGRRPFGFSMIIVGFDDKSPHLYMTDPAGNYCEWKATAIGRNSSRVLEFLENSFSEEIYESDHLTKKFALRALLEVVHSCVDNLELAVIGKDQPLTTLSNEELHALFDEIEKDKQDEVESKRARRLV